jgi:hypothetical protein
LGWTDFDGWQSGNRIGHGKNLGWNELNRIMI